MPCSLRNYDMNKVLLLLTIVVISLTSSCYSSQEVHVIIEENHRWEEVSGRRMWHTLRYNMNNSVETLHLSVGVREVILLLPHHKSHIFALNPLGTLAPYGGGITPLSNSKKVFLSSKEGPLTDLLLRILPSWSALIENLNYENIVRDIKNYSSPSLIDYRALVQDLVEGNYNPQTFRSVNTYTACFDILPSGRYISDSFFIPSFYKNDYRESVIEDLPSGNYYFFHYQLMMVCSIVVPDNEELFPTYSMKTPDSIFRISNSEYQKILEGRGLFP
jgi:hypothetical protein